MVSLTYTYVYIAIIISMYIKSGFLVIDYSIVSFIIIIHMSLLIRVHKIIIMIATMYICSTTAFIVYITCMQRLNYVASALIMCGLELVLDTLNY